VIDSELAAQAPRRGLPARSRPIKVVHVVVAGEIGGAETMLADLAARPELSGAVHVLALMTRNAGLARLFESSGLLVRHRLGAPENAASFLWRALGPRDVEWLTGVLEAELADVVHLHTVGSHVIGTRAALRRGARIVRTEHSTRAYADPTCRPFSAWSLARSHRVVAVSRHVREVVLSRNPTLLDRVVLVPNGVDTERFAPRADARRPGPFVFAWVGRLERRKGADLALEALARVPGAHLEIIGEGPERAALARQAAALGLAARVRFRGFLRDTRAPLALADAALCSSRTEGLGIALLEAMAMGLPVVAFRVGGVPEFVTDGRTGWLARDGTSAALAACMREALLATEDQRTALGRAGRAAVQRGYSTTAMCQGYGSVYASLVHDRREHPCPATSSPS
jgi:glycosyltransferase involved in cell wall biosynthesis